MAEAPVLRDRLERVADGVAEVQDAPQAGLALVRSTTTSALMRQRLGDDRQRAPPASRAKIAVGARATRSNSARLGDHAVLDHLVEPGAELAPRQRREQRSDRRRRAAAGETRRSGSCRARWLTPTLPPIALSTCASSVVGTWTSGMPRRKVAAAKPAMSPTTPPPTATIALDAIGAGADQRVVDARRRSAGVL